MTIKEELAAKKAALKDLEEKIKAGDAEAIEAGEALAGEIDTLEEQTKKAAQAEKLINLIGTDRKEDTDMDIKSMNLEELKTMQGSRSFALKDAANTDVHTKPP